MGKTLLVGRPDYLFVDHNKLLRKAFLHECHRRVLSSVQKAEVRNDTAGEVTKGCLVDHELE